MNNVLLTIDGHIKAIVTNTDKLKITNKDVKEQILKQSNQQFFGRLGLYKHEIDDRDFNDGNVSHLIKDIKESEQGELICKVEILQTRSGITLASYLKSAKLKDLKLTSHLTVNLETKEISVTSFDFNYKKGNI